MNCPTNFPRVGSVLDYGWCYGDWLLDDDIVVTSTWSVIPNSATLSNDSINSEVIVRKGFEQRAGTCTAVFFSPAVVGNHVLTNTITTRDGRTERFDIALSVLP